jgi:hypothetical protein
MMKTELGMIKGPLSRAAKGAAKKAEKQKAGEKGRRGGPHPGLYLLQGHLSVRFTPFSFPWLIDYHHSSTILNGQYCQFIANTWH